MTSLSPSSWPTTGSTSSRPAIPTAPAYRIGLLPLKPTATRLCTSLTPTPTPPSTLCSHATDSSTLIPLRHCRHQNSCCSEPGSLNLILFTLYGFTVSLFHCSTLFALSSSLSLPLSPIASFPPACYIPPGPQTLSRYPAPGVCPAAQNAPPIPFCSRRVPQS